MRPEQLADEAKIKMAKIRNRRASSRRMAGKNYGKRYRKCGRKLL